MENGRTIFAQLTDFLPQHEFRVWVERYGGNHKIKSFTCWDQYLCMVFAQLTYRESLRDIEACLRVSGRKLYHMGIRGKVSRNTLANANKTRDWRIYAGFAQVLIQQARALYAGDGLAVELDTTAYALDASTIDLCMSLFPWAQFRKTKAAIKLHTLMDLRGNIPALVVITDGKVHDRLVGEPGAIYIMDRGYLDFARLHAMHQALSFFIIRAKKNLDCRRVYSHPVDKSTGLQCDQTVVLDGPATRKHYPDQLRRIRFFDAENDKRLVFLTNNFTLPALSIAELYRSRWQVELFFKWIKQHLRIKKFYGTSANAVKTQIWIAISAYLLVAILKKRLNLDQSLYNILQILSVSLFEKTPILQAFSSTEHQNEEDCLCNQLMLFD
jgi:hypothetical protein